MSTPLLVAAEAAAELRGDISSVVASLPISLALSTNSDAEVIAIDGTKGWVDRAIGAIESGARGIVVIEPTREPVDDLVRHPARRDVPVVLDHRWASHPAIRTAITESEALSGSVAFIDLVATVASRDLNETMNELRVIAAHLAGPTTDDRLLTPRPDCLIRIAHLPGSEIPVTLTAIRASTSDDAVTARIVTSDGDMELTIPDPGSARPARIVTTTTTGSTITPSRWESSHRSSWRKVVDLIDAKMPSTDLDDFAAIQNG